MSQVFHTKKRLYLSGMSRSALRAVKFEALANRWFNRVALSARYQP